jgi:hypothetical protein
MALSPLSINRVAPRRRRWATTASRTMYVVFRVRVVGCRGDRIESHDDSGRPQPPFRVYSSSSSPSFIIFIILTQLSCSLSLSLSHARVIALFDTNANPFFFDSLISDHDPPPTNTQHTINTHNYVFRQMYVDGEESMYEAVHTMRTRIITSPAFTGEKILGAILFENTSTYHVVVVYLVGK